MNHSPRLLAALVCLVFTGLTFSRAQSQGLSPLRVSDDQRRLVDANGQPFFWLGDTGWLLFKKLTREEAERYLEDRRKKGFNVIQVMLIHDIRNSANAYGDSALVGRRIAEARVTPGSDFRDAQAYDYWDHVDYILQLAERKGMYLALVPVWGSNVRAGLVSAEAAAAYGDWLGKRYRERNNVIWLNGGDIRGTDSMRVWQALGKALRQADPAKLITFHPFGRTQSSTWFHDAGWLSFHMFQSGHRRYDQDDTALAYGEDNWKYMEADYRRTPVKPSLDGEPSYEGIPQGLHDTLQPYWTDADVRRYAYWAAFSGAFGHTYGHNAVMQFHRPGDTPSYGAREYWLEALNAPGARQMQWLKKRMLSSRFATLSPDQSLIAEGTQGERYEHLAALRGKDHALVYTYTGRTLRIVMGKLPGETVRASWFDPRTGRLHRIGRVDNHAVQSFDPPGAPAPGNDWVLVLEGAKKSSEVTK